MTPTQGTWGFPDTVESVVKTRDNGSLIATAAVLHIPDRALVVDMTYGRGRFWTKYRPPNLVMHDLYTVDGVDFHNLPEADGTVDVAVFDPPYIPDGGELTTIPDMRDTYGVGGATAPQSVGDIADLYVAGIGEAYRILKRDGRLLVKTMDFVRGGKYHAMRHHVVASAVDVGFTQIDEFVHHSGTGPQPGGRIQRTSRRAHSFLCVFAKR